MAITDVRRLRSLKITETKGAKGTIQLTGSETYLVISDTANPAFNDIATNTAVWPKIGGTIPQINDESLFAGYSVYVTNRSFEYLDEENEFAVKVTVQYDAKAEEDSTEAEMPSGDGASPQSWTRFTVTTQSAEVPLTDEGADGSQGGKPACNSAGDPVDGLTEDRALLKIAYINTKVFNPDFPRLLDYVNTTNDAEFMGCGRRTLRCLGFNADFDDKNQAWTVTVDFLYDPSEWVVKYYDAGFNEVVGGKRKAILDIQGNPVSKPVPLDGAGKQLPVEDIDLGQYAGSSLVKLTAYPYLEEDFSIMFLVGGI